jgi:hypothetical protein
LSDKQHPLPKLNWDAKIQFGGCSLTRKEFRANPFALAEQFNKTPRPDVQRALSHVNKSLSIILIPSRNNYGWVKGSIDHIENDRDSSGVGDCLLWAMP